MLKQEYYMKDGVLTILREMIEVKLTLREIDLPDILDLISKECLLKEF